VAAIANVVSYGTQPDFSLRRPPKASHTRAVE